MNLGYMNGFAGKTKLVHTQFYNLGSAYEPYSYDSYGRFMVPHDATHALVTAAGRGAFGGYVYTGGGGAAACCFRIVFPIKEYNYIPYHLNGRTSLIIGGYNGVQDLSCFPAFGSMPRVVLSFGAGNSQSNGYGGNGGGATWQMRSATIAGVSPVASVTLNGGTGGTGASPGGDGSVYCFPDGGILASGAGGGSSNPTTGGNVPSPWGTQYGGNSLTANYGGGGASLFCDGQPPFGSWGAIGCWPGAGNGGDSGGALHGGGFIYIEFVSLSTLE